MKILETTTCTIEAMEELAKISGLDEENILGKLLTDVLSEHEWLIKHQAEGRIIMALEPSDRLILSSLVKNYPGNRESLTKLFDDIKIPQVLEYFQKAKRNK